MYGLFTIFVVVVVEVDVDQDDGDQVVTYVQVYVIRTYTLPPVLLKNDINLDVISLDYFVVFY